MAFIKHVHNVTELDNLLQSRNGLVTIDFWADWCGPCHMIAPVFEKLSNDYRHATFVKVDVDRSPDIAQRYQVTAMPTFKFIKNKEVVDTLMGANPPSLTSKIQQHAGPAPSASSSSSTGAGSSFSQPDNLAKQDAVSASDVSLLEYIDKSQLNCLNESDEHGIKSLIQGGGAAYLLSDADEQLLLNIYFNQTVRVRSIAFKTNEVSAGPKAIKLFINKPSLGFEDVENAKEPEASQVLDLTEAQVQDGQRITLRFVRFQSVNSLHIFVGSNHGAEDETRIDKIDIFGLPIQATKDLSGLRAAGEESH